jgi:DNA-binding transcriptional LysR family regulator
MWETVELRDLRVFLTLADELHFRRTAERLDLTPSRVSQTIRELEQKLGAQLVHRTSRRVRLTAFGERLCSEARPAYEALTGVLESTHEAARNLEGTLRLGLFSAPAGGPHLLALVDAFDKLHPECTLEVTQLSWDDPFAQLREGDVDLMASWLPLEQPDLVVGPTLSRQPRALAVARDHPLAKRERVSAEDLAEYRVPRFEGWPKELHEAWIPSKTPTGRPIPSQRMRVGERDVLDIAVRVGRGEIVHPTAPTAARVMGEYFDLVFVPITDLPPLSSALVWRRRASNPRLREFIRVAREVLRDAENVRDGRAQKMSLPSQQALS